MLESGWMALWPLDGWPLFLPVVLVAVLVGGLAVHRALKAPQILKDQQARHQQEMARLLEQR
ncbi:MAG: hypothetical protein EBS72_04590, partial [Rhizobiales bacterium]|nr:hypothetical protein [Hyphomicrobiales bacterium]